MQEHSRILSREITHYTDKYLPQPWNRVAQRISFSLPVAFILYHVPLSLQLYVGVGLYAIDLFVGPMEDGHYETFFRGAFIASSIRAIIDITEFRLSSIIYVVASSILWPHVKFRE